MASALSVDEFQRIQLQILDLRTENYTLADKCKRQERDLTSLRGEAEVYEKELQRANKALSKSKKAKEVELLLQENDALQRKLHNQEEDFRLQNETIMKELGQVIASNEKLEKELKQLTDSEGSLNENNVTGETHDELRRLQAENNALQKNLSGFQENHDAEVVVLQQTISDLESQCKKLAGQRETPLGENCESRQVEGQSDQESAAEDSFDGQETTDETLEISSSHDSEIEALPSKKNFLTPSEDNPRLINDLKLKLDTEREETKLLKEQLVNCEKSSKEQQHCLQEEVDKLTEKFKKKQDSLVQLQDEKEQMYTKLSAQIESLENRKETEVKKLSTQSEQLQSELAMCNKTLEELQKTSTEKITDLQSKLSELENKKKESKAAHHSCIAAQNALQEDRDKQITALQEINRVAEKRKALLDELAIKYQAADDQHREQTKALEHKHSTEIQKLSSTVNELEKRLKKYSDIEDQLEESKKQKASLGETKGWLERRLAELQGNLSHALSSHEEELAQLITDHSQQLETLTSGAEKQTQDLLESHSKQVENLESKLNESMAQKEEHLEVITRLQQDIQDREDAKKVHEKKGMTAVKDLKKQLVGERKRGEKLQERLQEYLQSDARSRTSVEELLRNSGTERYHGDGSSVGSWSATASGISRDGNHSSAIQSPEEEVEPSSVLDREHSELLNKVAHIQQQKWTLEEKVSHLESSNAAMCEDLISKTSIIEHYVMNSRTGNVQSPSSHDKMSFKRVIDFVKDKGDEDMRDMNRKLQTMLEETLTKNMHLQQNMEDMSLELVRLSKKGVTPPDTQPNKQ